MKSAVTSPLKQHQHIWMLAGKLIVHRCSIMRMKVKLIELMEIHCDACGCPSGGAPKINSELSERSELRGGKSVGEVAMLIKLMKVKRMEINCAARAASGCGAPKINGGGAR